MALDMEASLHLAAAVIRRALKDEGADWLLQPQGQYWCTLCGLQPAKTYAMAQAFCAEGTRAQWEQRAQNTLRRIYKQRELERMGHEAPGEVGRNE